MKEENLKELESKVKSLKNSLMSNFKNRDEFLINKIENICEWLQEIDLVNVLINDEKGKNLFPYSVNLINRYGYEFKTKDEIKDLIKELTKFKNYIKDFYHSNKCPCCGKRALLLEVDTIDETLEDGSDGWYNSTWCFKFKSDLSEVIDNLPEHLHACDKDRILWCNNCSSDYNVTTSIHYGEINALMSEKVNAIRKKIDYWL